MNFRIFLPFVALLAACQSQPSPAPSSVNAQETGRNYADYALETADVNRDGTLTAAEWKSVGGTDRAFLTVDRNKDGTVERAELVATGSSPQFIDFIKSRIDRNADSELTPREFRSPAGLRAFSFEF